jgi:hypothetical protein
LTDPDLIKQTAKDLWASVVQGYGKDFGSVDYDSPDYKALYNLENNVYVFSGFKTHQQLKDATLLLIDKDTKKIKPWGQYRRDILALDQTYNVQYLYAERNHAVASAQSARAWQDDYALKDEYYGRYRTVRDGKVRKKHQLLDDIIAPLDDDIWDLINPPNDWNDRCIRDIVHKDKADPTDPERAKRLANEAMTEIDKNGNNRLAMFRTNPGKSYQVFGPENSYEAATPEKDRKEITSAALTAKGFRDATTIVEAEQFAIQAGIAEIVSYKGLPLEICNRTNKALLELKERFGVTYHAIKKTYVVDKKDNPAYLAANARNKATKKQSLYLNAFKLVDPDLDRSLMADFASGWFNASNFEGIIYHEFGHRMTVDKLYKLSKQQDELIANIKAYQTSTYSKENAREILAELYVLFIQGSELSKKQLDLIKKYSI